MSQFGDRIKQVRGSIGVGEFATILGVNRKTVTRWEASEALPDGQSLLALMNHFKAEPRWVLTGAGAAPALEAAEQVLLENYRRCGPQARANLVQTSALLAAGLSIGETAQPQPSHKFEGSMQVFHQAPKGQVGGGDIVNNYAKKTGKGKA